MILADEHGEFPDVGVGPRVFALEEFVDFSLGIGSLDHGSFIRLFCGLCRLPSSVYPRLWSEQIATVNLRAAPPMEKGVWEKTYPALPLSSSKARCLHSQLHG